jgi:hypothetical protein
LQRLPLEQADYDIPIVTNQLSATIGEVGSWMEMITQQINNCVLYPVRKLRNELDDVVGTLKPGYADAQVSN